jgi:alkylation response protein AidB-like acyl-CoA dehydrogenase
MDDDTRTLLRDSIRGLFDSGGDVAAGLDDLGWSDVVADDPVAAVDLFFTEQGALGKSSAVLDTVACVDFDGTCCPVVHPIDGRTSARLDGDEIRIDGALLSDADRAVIATDAAAFVVDLTTCEGTVTEVAGFDPGSRLRRIRVGIERDAATEVDVDWASITAAAERALSSELVGNGSAMLRLAADQITDRVQFGRPIGANQSPRHRLAEGYALIRGAAELSAVAWRTGSAADSRTAKTYAGYAVDMASRACLQVCGAIGLTTEHALPGYVTRGRILDALYGGWAESTADIGRRLLVAGSVPTAARL